MNLSLWSSYGKRAISVRIRFSFTTWRILMNIQIYRSPCNDQSSRLMGLTGGAEVQEQ